MSMWEATLIIGMVAAPVLIFAAYYSYVKAQLFRLGRYEYWTDRFYSAAKPLVANPETPPRIISLIASMNDLICDKDAPLGIYSVYRKKIEKRLPQEAKAERNSDLSFKPFFQKFPELAQCAEVVTHSGMMAATYAGLTGGTLARAVLADVFSEMQIQQYEIGDAQDIREASNVHRGAHLVPLIMRR